MMACDAVRECDAFKGLMRELKAHVTASYRNALSGHTTQACAIRNTGAPVTSLKACGLEDAMERNGKFAVRVELPNAFTDGDGTWLALTGGFNTSVSWSCTARKHPISMMFVANRVSWAAVCGADGRP